MRQKVRNWLEDHKQPAILVMKGDPASQSWLGGRPSVPPGFVWPTVMGKSVPFLAQIRLSEIPPTTGVPTLPKTGSLYFFFSAEHGGWSPRRASGGYAVIYRPEEDGLAEINPPDQDQTQEPEIKGWKKLFIPKPAPKKRIGYPRQSIAFSAIATYSDLSVELQDGCEGQEASEVSKLCGRPYKGGPEHQLFGHPRGVRYARDQMARYVADSTSPDAERWFLLLQIDEDLATEFKWVNFGKVFFWISERDLAQANFERVRAIIDHR